MSPLEHRSAPGHRDDADSGQRSRWLLLLGAVVLLLVVLGVMALIGEWQL